MKKGDKIWIRHENRGFAAVFVSKEDANHILARQRGSLAQICNIDDIAPREDGYSEGAVISWVDVLAKKGYLTDKEGKIYGNPRHWVRTILDNGATGWIPYPPPSDVQELTNILTQYGFFYKNGEWLPSIKTAELALASVRERSGHEDST